MSQGMKQDLALIWVRKSDRSSWVVLNGSPVNLSSNCCQRADWISFRSVSSILTENSRRNID